MSESRPQTVSAILAVDHLCKSYGSTVAGADISFTVARNEIVGLLGPNGAGNTIPDVGPFLTHILVRE